MNIDKIRNAYDPEFDVSYSDHSPPVTWVEMELAEELEKALKRIEQLEDRLERLAEATGWQLG